MIWTYVGVEEVAVNDDSLDVVGVLVMFQRLSITDCRRQYRRPAVHSIDGLDIPFASSLPSHRDWRFSVDRSW